MEQTCSQCQVEILAMTHIKRSISIISLALVFTGMSVFSSTTNATPQAKEIVETLLKNKTLVLLTKTNFMSYAEQAPDKYNYLGMYVKSSKMIRQFGFKALMSRPGLTETVMKVAADTNHVTVVVQSPNGLPYCILSDHFALQCDPQNPGGLLYSTEGTIQWGYYQAPDLDKMALSKQQMEFSLTFLPMNTTPSAFLEANHLVKEYLDAATNTTYTASTRTVQLKTKTAELKLILAKSNPEDPFGIQELEITKQNSNARLGFSEFKFGAKAQHDLLKISIQDLKRMGLPLRELKKGQSFSPLIPPGFPSSPKEKAASDKLKELIETLQKTSTTTAMKKEKASNP